MKNHFLSYVLLFILAFSAQNALPQENNVEKMRDKASVMRKEIEKKEAILLSKEKDINSRLNNYKIITAKIDEHKKLVDALKAEVRALDGKIGTLDKEMKEIDREMQVIDKEIQEKEAIVEKSRNEYAEALRKTRKYSNFENKLLFIFSADDFSTMARRYRYAKNNLDAHKTLEENLRNNIAGLDYKKAELQGKKDELQGKKDELNKTRESRKSVLKEQEAERAKIQKLEKEQKSIIAGLEKEKSKYEAELKKQKNELSKLNAAIEKEVEKVVTAEVQKQEQTPAKTSGKKEDKTKESDKSSYKEDAGTKKMSGSFESNKGNMTIPISGAYLIVDQFGKRNAVGTKGNVMIDNGGLTFKGTKGAKARAVFDGTVSTVFYHNDYICVLVRHGKYISVYCNLSNVKVKSGQNIKNGEIIGEVAVDAADGNPSLLFQLYREKTLLNPAEWLKL